MIMACQTIWYDMIFGELINPGDIVRDTKLGLIWMVMDTEPDGTLHLERNGVFATAAVGDVELVERPTRPPQ
jgi:hypothetical protein